MTNKQKQHLLAYLGYYTGEIDGKWGGQSKDATARFQEDYDLDPDGIFGKLTEAKILEVIGSGVTAPKQQEAALGDFWDDIEYFTRDEFACPCPRCGGFPVEPDEKLVRLEVQVRKYFDAPAINSSGVRCQAHNDELSGSVPNSRHVLGKAVDFRIKGKSGAEVLAYVRTLPGVRYAYNIDGTYVHMDVD